MKKGVVKGPFLQRNECLLSNAVQDPLRPYDIVALLYGELEIIGCLQMQGTLINNVRLSTLKVNAYESHCRRTRSTQAVAEAWESLELFCHHLRGFCKQTLSRRKWTD